MSEYTFDLSKITIAEFREFSKAGMDEEKQDAILAKCAGVEIEELNKLSLLDYKRLLRAFFKYAMEPLSDPN